MTLPERPVSGQQLSALRGDAERADRLRRLTVAVECRTLLALIDELDYRRAAAARKNAKAHRSEGQ